MQYTVWKGKQAGFICQKAGRTMFVLGSVADPNKINLDPDSGFWPNWEPESGLYLNFERKN